MKLAIHVTYYWVSEYLALHFRSPCLFMVCTETATFGLYLTFCEKNKTFYPNNPTRVAETDKSESREILLHKFIIFTKKKELEIKCRTCNCKSYRPSMHFAPWWLHFDVPLSSAAVQRSASFQHYKKATLVFIQLHQHVHTCISASSINTHKIA